MLYLVNGLTEWVMESWVGGPLQFRFGRLSAGEGIWAMPLYEYECRSCGGQMEVLIRGSEKPVCPSCGSERLEKQLSVPAAHTASGQSLPMAGPPGPCGRPECGQGRCAF